MILYPRLEYSTDLITEAGELVGLSVADGRKYRRVKHAAAVYSAIGGTPATVTQLENIARGLTEIAEHHGYPADRSRQHTAVDAHWGEYLHANLGTSAHEAAFDSMWHFFTVSLVPDLVIWRWGSAKDKLVSDRWVTSRHRGRNAFGRLWWRCEIMILPDQKEPYQLVHGLGEDELVQIMERPSFAGNRVLSRTTAAVLIALHQQNPKINRALLLREYQKRMLRLGAFTDFQSLDDGATRKLALDIMDRTRKAIIAAASVAAKAK